MPTLLTFCKGEIVSTQLTDNWGIIKTNLNKAPIEAKTPTLTIVSARILLLVKGLSVLKPNNWIS